MLSGTLQGNFPNYSYLYGMCSFHMQFFLTAYTAENKTSDKYAWDGGSLMEEKRKPAFSFSWCPSHQTLYAIYRAILML